MQPSRKDYKAMPNVLGTEGMAQYAQSCKLSFHDFKGICTCKAFLQFLWPVK